jgi:hypothetical protein
MRDVVNLIFQMADERNQSNSVPHYAIARNLAHDLTGRQTGEYTNIMKTVLEWTGEIAGSGVMPHNSTKVAADIFVRLSDLEMLPTVLCTENRDFRTGDYIVTYLSRCIDWFTNGKGRAVARRLRSPEDAIALYDSYAQACDMLSLPGLKPELTTDYYMLVLGYDPSNLSSQEIEPPEGVE